jgi:putative transposase
LALGGPRYRDGRRNAGGAAGAPKLFTFPRFPKSQWRSIRTSHAIVVRQLSAIPYQDRFALHEGLRDEFKRRTKTRIVLLLSVPMGAQTAAMVFWALLASGRITIRKIDGWRNIAGTPFDQIIGLAA